MIWWNFLVLGGVFLDCIAYISRMVGLVFGDFAGLVVVLLSVFD